MESWIRFRLIFEKTRILRERISSLYSALQSRFIAAGSAGLPALIGSER